MPIVTVELIEDEQQQPVHAAAIKNLTDELGELFNSAPGGTWLKLRYLPRQHYAENETTLSRAIRPTFVEVLKRDADTSATDRATEAARIAEIVAQHFDRPIANTHIIYAPSGAGRVAFGGTLIPLSE